MANITSQTLSAPVQQGFSSKLLVTPVPNMIHSVAAVQKRKDRQTGTTERFRRYNPLQPAMAPLGPTGATPPSQNQTVVDKLYVHIKSLVIDLKPEVALS